MLESKPSTSFPNLLSRRPRLFVSWKRSEAKSTVSSIADIVSVLKGLKIDGYALTIMKLFARLYRAIVYSCELNIRHEDAHHRDLRGKVSRSNSIMLTNQGVSEDVVCRCVSWH